MNAVVKLELQQVKVEIKTEVKPERKPPGERLAQQARAVRAELRAGGLPTHGGAEELTARLAEHGHGWTEPDVKGAAAPAAKRRRVGGTAPSGGAFCRRSRPRVPPPAVAAGGDGRDRGVATSAAVGAQPAVGFASDPRGPTGPHPHEAAWEAQLARLAAYKAAHGDCDVPKRWAKDPGLGYWANHQRWYKQQLDRGEPSAGMTAERAARLTALGFVWNQWEGQLAQLAAYKVAHGNCNVPQGWREDPSLASWVNTQRRYKRKLDRGEPSEGMTAERAARLTALGFAWNGEEAAKVAPGAII
jgi:hypothetical protein